ncbi:MAG: SDR family oxidoreductase [Pseudomonadota bacterium]
MARFQDRAAIVTGGGSGFGEAIARRLASEGCNVLIADINDASAQRVAESIGNAAGFIGCDVSKATDIEGMVQRCLDAFGKIDILVNNAGYSHRSMLMWNLSEEEYDGVFNANVKGVFLGCKYALPHMIERKSGVIINTASIGAVAPRPGVTAYNATKGAVLTMTKGLALEVARHNIRVNCVNPVAADTGFMKGAMGVTDGLSAEQTSNLTSTIPLRRLSTPDDVAAAVCFLASDEASMITGTALNVDGGRSV